MRIGIDARFLTHPQRGGFKTYSEHLAAALAELDGGHEYVLYLDRKPGPEHALPTGPRVTTRVVPGALPAVGMPWREQVSLALQAARDRLDLFHAPCLTAPLALACPLVVTIHDMIWRRPAEYGAGQARAGRRALMERYYRLVPALAARRAAAVITVSHAAQADIVRDLGLPTGSVMVTHEAAKPVFRAPADPARAEAMRARFGLAPGYLLAIGSADPRKNLAALLRAYAGLSQRQRAAHRLAIVWTHPRLAGEIGELARELRVAGEVSFLEQVSDEELAALYAGAALFVFPSLYEGFGLPLLEAMACGAPVVAAATSSIPEITGDAALLTAPDAPALAWAIGRALAAPELRAELAARGLRRAAAFSWRRCAEETVAVYEAVAAGSRTKGRLRVEGKA